MREQIHTVQITCDKKKTWDLFDKLKARVNPAASNLSRSSPPVPNRDNSAVTFCSYFFVKMLALTSPGIITDEPRQVVVVTGANDAVCGYDEVHE